MMLTNSVIYEGFSKNAENKDGLFCFTVERENEKGEKVSFPVLCSEYAKQNAEIRMKEGGKVRVIGSLERAGADAFIFADVIFFAGEE